MTAEQIGRNLALADALESGKYEQGKWRLRKDSKFCCLGVACDLIDPEGWELLTFDEYKLYRFHGENFVVPLHIVDLYGWSSSNPILPEFYDDDYLGAGALNDDGASFSELASGFRSLAAQGGGK